MKHEMSQSVSPISVTIRCTCGWHRQITRRQNALARTAKVRAAFNEHRKQITAEAAREANAHVAEPFRSILNTFAREL